MKPVCVLPHLSAPASPVCGKRGGKVVAFALCVSRCVCATRRCAMETPFGRVRAHRGAQRQGTVCVCACACRCSRSVCLFDCDMTDTRTRTHADVSPNVRAEEGLFRLAPSTPAKHTHIHFGPTLIPLLLLLSLRLLLLLCLSAHKCTQPTKLEMFACFVDEVQIYQLTMKPAWADLVRTCDSECWDACVCVFLGGG